jgi:hypothetical protein
MCGWAWLANSEFGSASQASDELPQLGRAHPEARGDRRY